MRIWPFGKKKEAKQAALILPGDGGFRTLQSYYSAAKLTGVAWACVSRISQRVAAADWRVVNRAGQPADYGEANNKLANPGGLRHGKHAFYKILAEQLLIDGNAYAMARRDSAGVINAFTAVESRHVNVNDVPGQELTYRVDQATLGNQGDGSVNHIRSNIVHARLALTNQTTAKGQSPLKAAENACALYGTTIDTTLQTLNNSVKMGGHFELDMVTAGGTEQNYGEFAEWLSTELKAAKNAGRSIVLKPGLKYVPPGKATPEIDLDKLLDVAIADVARTFGVPLQLLQATGGSGTFSADELETRLIRDAVKPVADAIADAIADKLIAQQDRHLYFVMADLQPLSGVSDRNRVDQAMKMGQSGVFTTDEIRHVAGYDALPNGAGSGIPETAGAGNRRGEGNA